MDTKNELMMYLLCLMVVSVAAEGYSVAYCVSVEEDFQCNTSNATNTIANVADLASIADERVLAFLSIGTHILAKNLTINDAVREIMIQGTLSSQGEVSKILCQNSSGLFFNRLNAVLLRNIAFERCHRKHQEKYIPFSIGIRFEKVDYLKLDRITVTDGRGYGFHATNCYKQVIHNSHFRRNLGGHARVSFKRHRRETNVTIDIYNTTFHAGSNDTYRSGGLDLYLGLRVNGAIRIDNTRFIANRGRKSSHMVITAHNNTKIEVSNCLFTEGDGPHNVNAYGVVIESKVATLQNLEVVLNNSNFTNSNKRGIQIIDANNVHISYCLIANNTGTGLNVKLQSEGNRNSIFISHTNFTNNSRALYLRQIVKAYRHFLEANITNCQFTDHYTPRILPTSAARAVVQIEGITDYRISNNDRDNNAVRLERCQFENNHDEHSDCSTLHATNMKSVILNDVMFKNNNCTGVSLVASVVVIENHVNLTKNHGLLGGAMYLGSKEINSEDFTINKFSQITLSMNSTMHLLKNHGKSYGGGIYTDETCEYTNNLCFIQFQGMPNDLVLTFSENTAEMGGDSIFGGCLTNCQLKLPRKHTTVNVSDPNSIFWSFASFKSLQPSAIVDRIKKAVFCKPQDDLFFGREKCSSTHTVEAYRGQEFELSMMVVDDSCAPIVEFITANPQNDHNSSIQLLSDRNYYRSKKYCANFSYAMTGESSLQSARVEFSPSLLHTMSSAALLTVNFRDCPAGFKSESTSCACHDALNSYNIICSSKDMTLEIPTFTWLGTVNNSTAVSNYCRFCKTTSQVIKNTGDSNKLCSYQRTGILCGSCCPGCSRLLGSYRCGKCNSILQAILLIVAFIAIGIVLILALFFFNITVSSGILNAVIFYCNIVHSSTDTFLPTDITSADKGTLQTMVRVMSTFIAWMNLDFGITACFFDGYDTYISTWMQFVFPLYIWLLVLLIVLASRHSRKVSKLTTSNTVPVLATLLLLSYAKLLITCLEVISLTKLEILDTSSKKIVWFLDGNISYFSSKHIPLFLMSILTLAGYILPFTLLILLGPLLQAKSEHRPFRWINQLKPFLDAFYGPYTSRYRYWPGILLLARSTHFIATIYSLGDIVFKLQSATAITTLLLIFWVFLSQKEKTLIYSTKSKNYLELSIFLNLAAFSIFASYLWSTDQSLHKKQVLATVMVGLVFITFCGIMLHYALLKYKKTRNIIATVTSRLTQHRKKKVTNTPQDHNSSSLGELSTTTHSTLELPGNIPMSKLREPLLNDLI